jgi:hypothetical protein
MTLWQSSQTAVVVMCVTGNVVVVEVGGRPPGRGVAVVAGVTALDMAGNLTDGRLAVVTALAGADHL